MTDQQSETRQSALWRTLALVVALSWAQPAATQDMPVALELVLSADTSSSIRGPEFDLQISGYANAFRDPAVIAAITDLGGNGVAVLFTQWSATFQHYDSVTWTVIGTAQDSHAFADAIERQARRFTGFATATGNALHHAARQIDNNGFSGQRQVIDIVSDERSNQGLQPRSVRDAIVARGMTINGLVVLDDDEDLIAYFEDQVIGGPGAFVMAVDDYGDFAEAIKRKLLREISSQPLARRDGQARRDAALARATP